MLLDDASPAGKPHFDIVQYESRFSQLREDAPHDTVLGYLTDADESLTSTQAEYILAQYAMAPAVVARDLKESWVIGNVHTPQPPAFYQVHGLELVRDYGNGVLLLRKLKP